MDVTKSQPNELKRQQRQQQEHQEAELVPESDYVVEEVVVMTTVESEPRGQTMQIGTRRFLAPVSFDDVSPKDFKWVALIPWFDLATMRADGKGEFSSLALYACKK